MKSIILRAAEAGLRCLELAEPFMSPGAQLRIRHMLSEIRAVLTEEILREEMRERPTSEPPPFPPSGAV